MAVTKDIVRYSLMPGIMPRIKGLVGSSFFFLASLIATIYHNVGLLPRGHEYLNPQNIGRFGIRHVVAEASRNLVFDKKHLDQIIFFFLILLGLTLIVVQILLLVVSLMATPVFASTFYSMFIQVQGAAPSKQDLAFVVLENVFGIKQFSGTGSALGFYDSCISDLGTQCEDIRGNPIPSPGAYPLPFHTALHSMLHFYTLGIAFLAGAVILYFVVTIVGETVTSGTPFGQRLNKAWFIPRLIVFFALIAPIGTTGNNAGINVAQLFVFSAAKYGSNMASNTWLNFADNAAAYSLTPSEFFMENRNMAAFIKVPESGGLTQFMHIVRMCIVAEKIINGIDIYPYFVRPHSDDTNAVLLHDGTQESGGLANMGGTTDDYLDAGALAAVRDFERAVVFSRYNTVVLRFGHRNPPISESADPSGVTGAPGSQVLAPNNRLLDDYAEDWGFVEPTCGELHFEITSLDTFVLGESSIIGVSGIQQNYFLAIEDYLGAAGTAADQTVMCMVRSVLPYGQDHSCIDQTHNMGAPFGFSENTRWLTAGAARADIEFFNAENEYYINGWAYDWGSLTAHPDPYVMDEIRTNYDLSAYKGNLLMPTEIRERGWAGAALWYNKIAELNGMISSAMQNVPAVYRYPKVMEQIAEQHKRYDANFSYGDRFNPRLQNGQLADLPRPGDQYIAALLYNDYNFWRAAAIQETVFTRSSKNVIIDFINTAFGTHGLLGIMENEREGTHPLAMLSSAGKSMVDASLNNLFLGVVGQGIGEILSDDFFGTLGTTAGEFLVTFSLVTLSIGFMLYYVLPFMPFIYFFFAFGGWVKSIFEAVVAMPLWAVAHLKIDGEGLPGPLATNGYFLLFEIFLRPTLIIVGLLASIALFTALVDTLHDVYQLLVFTATGYDIQDEIFNTSTLPLNDSMDFWRSPIDELFYTAIYVILVYMIGLSCFKLIDEIPNNIMRWMGVTVSTFHETSGENAGELTGKMYRATQMTNAQIQQMIGHIKGRKDASDVVTQTGIATQL